NASFPSVVTRWPDLSTTVVWHTTSRVSDVKIAGASFCCAQITAAVSRTAPTPIRAARVGGAGAFACQPNLFSLRRRIIPLLPEWLQDRHPTRLHQLHLHLSILPIPHPILRLISQHILIA